MTKKNTHSSSINIINQSPEKNKKFVLPISKRLLQVSTENVNVKNSNAGSVVSFRGSPDGRI